VKPSPFLLLCITSDTRGTRICRKPLENSTSSAQAGIERVSDEKMFARRRLQVLAPIEISASFRR